MPDDLRVLVCGGRNYDDAIRVQEVLDRVDPVAICHGGARGVDALAGEWARARGVPCHVYEADWGVYGKKAGPLRNKAMLDAFDPDLVIAFPGGPGTENMLTLARKAHVRIMQITK